MGIPERAQEWYKAQSSFSQLSRCLRCWDQCYAQEHAERDDVKESVLPVDAVDVLAHNQRVLNFTFVVVDPESVANIKDNRKPIGSNAWAIAPAHSATGRQCFWQTAPTV